MKKMKGTSYVEKAAEKNKSKKLQITKKQKIHLKMKYFLISVYYQPIISDYCKYRKEVPKKK